MLIQELTTNLAQTFDKHLIFDNQKNFKLNDNQDVNNGNYSKSFISATILSYLYRLLCEDLLSSNQNICRKLINKLFFKSFEPYLNILNRWLKNGTLMDKYNEFYLKNQRDSQSLNTFYSKLDWYNDYCFHNYTTKWQFDVVLLSYYDMNII